MTVASKTRLLSFDYVGRGGVFCDVTGRSNIDTSDISDYVRLGNTFFGSSVEETLVYPSPSGFQQIRQGSPYLEKTANANINASEFDVVRRGAPFWVTWAGEPPEPPTFNQAQFFIMF